MSSFLLQHHFNAIAVTVEQNDSYRDRWPPWVLLLYKPLIHPPPSPLEMVPTSETCEFILELIWFDSWQVLWERNIGGALGTCSAERPFQLWFPHMLGRWWVVCQCSLDRAPLKWTWPSWKGPDLRCVNGKHPRSSRPSNLGGVTGIWEASCCAEFCQGIWQQVLLAIQTRLF